MFCLAEFKDHVCLPPTEIGFGSRLGAVKKLLRRRCLNKVVQDAGVAVCLGDVLEIGSGVLQPGEATIDLPVRFSLVIFRPFLGEVIVGKLARCDKTGLYVSLEFFDDVFIPSKNLPDPSEYDEQEKQWVWKGGNDDGDDLPLEVGEEIRLRVADVIFQKQNTSNAIQSNEHVYNGSSGLFSPMVVVGDINFDGLGPLSWWQLDEEDDEDGEAKVEIA